MCECQCKCCCHKPNPDQPLIDEFKSVRQRSLELYDELRKRGYKVETEQGYGVEMVPLRIYKPLSIPNREYF